MAQNENYSQVDLRVGTEEQFNAKVGTLPAGTLFGTTDSTVSKADLSTDLKNEINGKINKPANPTSDSAVVINSSGTVSTKPLSSITGKAEVAVNTTQPAADSPEILWINPDGTSGGGGSSGGGKLYSYKYAGALSQSGSHGMPTVYVYFQFYLPYLIEINTYEKFRSICEKVYGKDTYIPVTFHRVGLDAYYSGAFRFYKSSADNYVRFFFCGITSDSSDTNPAIFAYYTDANALIPPAANDVNKQWSDVVNLTVTEV